MDEIMIVAECNTKITRTVTLPLWRIKEILLTVNTNVVKEVRLSHVNGIFTFTVGSVEYRYWSLDLDVEYYRYGINELIKMLNEVRAVSGNIIRFNYINTELNPYRFTNTTIVNGSTIELIEDTFSKERTKSIGLIQRVVNKFMSL